MWIRESRNLQQGVFRLVNNLDTAQKDHCEHTCNLSFPNVANSYTASQSDKIRERLSTIQNMKANRQRFELV